MTKAICRHMTQKSTSLADEVLANDRLFVNVPLGVTSAVAAGMWINK